MKVNLYFSVQTLVCNKHWGHFLNLAIKLWVCFIYGQERGLKNFMLNIARMDHLLYVNSNGLYSLTFHVLYVSPGENLKHSFLKPEVFSDVHIYSYKSSSLPPASTNALSLLFFF